MIVADSSGDTVKSDPLARVINTPTNDNARIGKNAVLSINKIKSHDFNVPFSFKKYEKNTNIVLLEKFRLDMHARIAFLCFSDFVCCRRLCRL